MPKPFVPIIMGSMSDSEHAEKIGSTLKAVRIFALGDEKLASELQEYMIKTRTEIGTYDVSARGILFGTRHAPK